MRPDVVELENEGRAWVRGALDVLDLADLDRALRMQDAPGARMNWNQELLHTIGETSRLTQLAGELLPGARPVRIVVFDKSLNKNWQVPWHQDRVIAVREKHEVWGFDNWTNKAGMWHVEPPIELLRNMIFARVHLDDTDECNGCLELVPGSHRHGKINAEDALKLAQRATREICKAQRGDVVFVKALALHRSLPSRRNVGRRTLRVDYCAERLPEPLEWAL